MQRLNRPFQSAMNVMHKILCIMILFAWSGGVIYAGTVPAAETVTAKGTVADIDGEPLPGVTVTQTGTQNIVVTNLDGEYTISVPKGSVIEFTYIGKDPSKVTVTESRTYDVTLYDNETMLDEVMVTGYSTTVSYTHLTLPTICSV